VSNTDEKEKPSYPFDDSLPESPAKLLKKEPTAPFPEELPAKEATPFLSALSPAPLETAPPRPAKTYPKPQRKTVFFGDSEVAALEEEFKTVSSPKPPSIPPQRVSAVAHPPTYLPIPTPEALNAQAGQTESFALSPKASESSSGVLGIPSENLLSPEDHGEVADPSETLSALLDEVFSEELPNFEDMFPLQISPLSPAVQPSFATPPPPLPPPQEIPALTLPEAPPWDPISTMVALPTQTQPPPPSLEFVIPGAHPLEAEPSISLFEEPTETGLEEDLLATQTTLAQEVSLLASAVELSTPEEGPLSAAEALREAALHLSEVGTLKLDADDIFQETLEQTQQTTETQTEVVAVETLKDMAAPAEDKSPLAALLEKEVETLTAPTTPAAPPIFQFSSPPRFVDPETQPASAVAPSFHPLEKTHEAVPASLPRLLGAFFTDALLLCSASLGMLWAAKTFTEPQASANVSSWFGNTAAWQVLGPTGVALFALLAGAYATFFALTWNGATPGRKLLGLRLVNKEGHTLGFLRAFVRGLLSLLSFGFMLAGFWWALIDKRRQTLHDKCTGTFVVRVQPRK